jgi:hypothetical protein
MFKQELRNGKNNIDICAEEIKDYYFICLKENNGRIFANSATYRVKIWEQVEQKAFRKVFLISLKHNLNTEKPNI